MARFRVAGLALALFLPLAGPAPAPARTPSYVDVADLVVASPVIVQAFVERSRRLSGRLAPDVPPGEVRHLVEARLVTVLKAPGLLPDKAAWSWQGPKGREAGRGQEVLVFLRPAEGQGAGGRVHYRLASREAQFPADPAMLEDVRAILKDLAAHGGVAPAVAAVRAGFHVPGTIEGESESQFFLELASARPLTLVVRRRPGEAPQVLAATGDFIDAEAQPVARRTLLWRALACDLPRDPPGPVAGDAGLERDWQVLLADLGPCDRSGRPGAQPARPDSTTPTAPASG
ncbi:MAG: hypothetical protein NZM40_05075 [Sphingomonadaceae bacterium]|uniref:hypothetical protein n=1 Tax=Thermaurantiacus sp. TaxID=2820283 RepID=UPI00298EE0EB|nr:hypothetical protein [Thermaurantiacus sp.]MCS6986790.1 hypothetical protein [Sphingomonadaceae bacterium]MDW8413947.1 hypothetical protein [Thermaurantiacus sp.]